MRRLGTIAWTSLFRMRALPIGGGAALLVFVCGATVAAADGGDPCAGQGNATLALEGETPPAVGTTFGLRITGLPFAPFTLLADVGDGPVEVPHVGTVCLDLGPRMRTILDGIRTGSPLLDAQGSFSAAVRVPYRMVIGGRKFHLQAIVRDATAPNGFAISNGLAFEILPSIFETFDTTGAKDAHVTSALWAGDGRLIGVPKTALRVSEYRPLESSFRLAHPLIEVGNPATPLGVRFQMEFDPIMVGAVQGESLLGMSWSPNSGFVFQSNYRAVTIKVGNLPVLVPGLKRQFDLNYDTSDSPVTVFEGDYSLTGATGVAWVDWPSFATDFYVRTDRPLVFEFEMPAGGDTYQLFRNNSTRSFPMRREFNNAGSDTANNARENTTYHARFLLQRLRGVAQSTWYSTGLSASPQWKTPSLVIRRLPQGTSVEIEIETALDADGDGMPDAGTETGFRTDFENLTGTIARFRLTLRPNDQAEVPIVAGLAIPYVPASE